VKLKGQFLPCPAGEQPDYDEIVAFNPDAVLPMAAFKFKRRRRTLLWVDDHPDHNYDMLRTFPGCPLQSTALHVQACPMQAAASAVIGEFAGRDISMEEQTDVLL
jgi:hypothetical protein